MKEITFMNTLNKAKNSQFRDQSLAHLFFVTPPNSFAKLSSIPLPHRTLVPPHAKICIDNPTYFIKFTSILVPPPASGLPSK